MHKLANKEAEQMDSFEVNLMIRAVKLTIRDIPHVKSPVDIVMLRNVCRLVRFDSTRHLTRGNVSIRDPGLIIALKWSKTLQTPLQPQCIPIVQVADEVLDVVNVFKRVVLSIPAAKAQSLFTLPGGKCLTLGQLRRIFKVLLCTCGYNTKDFSVHSLRRGGATESFKGGANYIDLKRHGTWNTSTFWSYVARPPPDQSSVCSALRTQTEQ